VRSLSARRRASVQNALPGLSGKKHCGMLCPKILDGYQALGKSGQARYRNCMHKQYACLKKRTRFDPGRVQTLKVFGSCAPAQIYAQRHCSLTVASF
jgi:hypothetical protein